jgi:hypothetical protein
LKYWIHVRWVLLQKIYSMKASHEQSVVSMKGTFVLMFY